MGIKLIILLALLIGVLYCIHLLVKDYQAVTAPRLLRALFKRDLHHQNYSKPNVRWKKILQFDPIQCARYFYCAVGASQSVFEVRQGFEYMLTLEPRDEDRSSQEVFRRAHQVGRSTGEDGCRIEYPLCLFQSKTLFELVNFLLHNHTEVHNGKVTFNN